MTDDYARLQARIADEVMRSDLTSQIAYAIADAIRHYERRRFWFNQKVASFGTVADQEYYGAADLADIPTLIQIDDVKILIDTATCPLTPMDFGMMDGLQTGAVRGDPLSYAYYAEQIRLYPMPSAARTVTMAYLCRLSPLTAGSDANAWTTEAETLIRQRAKRMLNLDVIKDDAEAARAGQLEAEALAELLAETRRRLSNGMLRTDIPQPRQRFSIVAGW
jgi:hypothetical protein